MDKTQRYSRRELRGHSGYLSGTALLIALVMLVNIIVSVILLSGNNIETLTREDTKIAYDAGSDTFLDGATGFVYDNAPKVEIAKTSGVSAVTDAVTKQMLSYTTPNANVVKYGEKISGGMITDSLTYRDRVVEERSYFDGDMLLDEILLGNYSEEIFYSEQGSVSQIAVGDQLFYLDYDSRKVSPVAYVRAAARTDSGSGLPAKVMLDGEDVPQAEYRYDGAGRVVYERFPALSTAFSYTYQGDRLLQKKQYRIVNGIDFNTYTTDYSDEYAETESSAFYLGTRYDYDASGRLEGLRTEHGEGLSLRFDHGFRGKTYLTEITGKDGSVCFEYLNDKLIYQYGDAYEIEYLLNNRFEYSALVYNGTLYYFNRDVFGRIDGLRDAEGRLVVSYSYDDLGQLIQTDGDMAAEMGARNAVVYDGSLIRIAESGLYATGDGVYDPASARVLSLTRRENLLSARVNVKQNISMQFQRPNVNKYSAMRDKLVEIARDSFVMQNLDSVSDVYISGEENEIIGMADLFTIPWELAPFSFDNLMHSCEVYDIVMRDSAWMKQSREKLDALTDVDTPQYIDYYKQYKPVKGTIAMSGQFVFLNTLVKYETREGLIVFDTYENDKANYDAGVNVWSYDENRYVQWNASEFRWDAVKGIVVTGLDRNDYKEAKAELKRLQSVLTKSADIMLQYSDKDIYRPENDHSLYSELDIPKGSTAVIGPNGEVNISLIPEPKSIWDSVWLGIGVALTAIALVTIAITVPGAGCIMASIALGAAKGALVGAASGFAMGFIMGGASNLINCAVTGEAVDWSGVLKDSLNAGIKGAVDGAITGAIMGGIGGALKPKFCFPAGTLVAAAGGKVAIENVRVGDSVLARDDRTGLVEQKKVISESKSQTHKIVEIVTNNERIKCTPDHPFYVVGQGYIYAELLSIGDELLTDTGNKVQVSGLNEYYSIQGITVYNFEVEEHHNYFVGKDCILVHNIGKCGFDSKTFFSKDIKQYKNVRMDVKTGTGGPNIHINFEGKHYYYNAKTRAFDGLPKKINNDPGIKRALHEALKFLKKVNLL